MNDKLNFWQSTALVTGNMIGSGIFLMPASLALYGGIGLLGWLFSSIGAIMLAIIFGYLSKYVSNVDGGPYAYTRAKLGDFPAFWVAWGYWVSIWSTNAAITVALIGYLAVFFPILNESPTVAITTGLFFIWLMTWINSRPIRTVGAIQLITVILKITPIFLIGFVGIFYVQWDNFPMANTSGVSNWSAITTTTMLTLFAFLGMESATIPSKSIEDADTTIQRATITGTIITVLVYLLSSAAIMGLIPPQTLANSSAPFADAAALIWGDTAKYLVAGGAVISTIGALNGWLLIQGQIPMAAAQDKLFPKIFKKTNKFGAPAIGIILSSILVSVLMMTKYSESLVEAFTFMMTLSTLSVITPYIFSIASFSLFIKNENVKTRIPKIILALLAFCFLIWIIIGCGAEVVFLGFILLMLGIPFYVGISKS
ncbi:MAG: amino acid permease [Saprospiraceae bacterium]